MAFFEICKARGDLLFPIRTVEKVRNVRCAAFQRTPGVYSGSIAVLFVLAYRSCNADAKHDGVTRRIVPLAITTGVESIYGFRTGTPSSGRAGKNPDGPIRFAFVISERIGGTRSRQA